MQARQRSKPMLKDEIGSSSVATSAAADFISPAEHNHINLLEMKRHRFFFSIARWLFGAILGIYVIVPLVLHYSETVQKNMIFLSLARWPLFINLKRPETCGIQHARNFYLRTEDDVTLGVWHILPANINQAKFINENADSEEFFDNLLQSGLPVVLYVHGNAGTRGGDHRVELYKILKRLNYHVVAFDYRGYADSVGASPSEEGVVNDTRFVYKWLRERVPAKSIIIWGHSLGTGISIELMASLNAEKDEPLALILEAPFNNLREGIRNHPLTLLYRYMPFFDEIILDGFAKNLEFASDKYIHTVTSPILMLHAEDDNIIPIQLGRRLYFEAVQSRSNNKNNKASVFFHQFDGSHGYAHKYIYRAPELPTIISEFINKCQAKHFEKEINP